MFSETGRSQEARQNWVPPVELSGSGPRTVKLRPGGIAMTCLAVVLIAGAFALYFWMARISAREASDRLALDTSGIETQGAVTRHWISGGKDHTPMLAYDFEYRGRRYAGQRSAPRREWETLQAGSPIAIRFLPDDPQVNHPSGWPMTVLPNWMPPLIGIFTSVSGFILFVVVRRQAALLRDGTPAAAQITGYRRVKGGVVLLYEFRTPDGKLVKGRGGHVRSAPETGSLLTVLYNPENPRRNSPYPLDAVRTVNPFSN